MLDHVLDQRCDDLYRAAEAEDAPRFLATLQDLWERTEESDAPIANALLVRLCGLFDRLPPGLGARLSVMSGAMVENGADPAPLVDPVVVGLCDALEHSAEFARAWRAVTDRRLPEPGPQDRVVLGAARVLSGPLGLPGRFGLGRRLPFARALDLAAGWALAEDWSAAATTVLQRSAAIRADLSRRPRLAAAVAATEEDRPDLWCLPRLLAVLDDEPLLDGHRVLVLDEPSHRHTWNIGRTYPMMRPSITLDRVLPEEEARMWSSRVAPGP
ncbi:hypothetical protein ACQPZZ_15775 [Microbispora sp. CA-135349]|uniref:hypothetical protein n=1 Tax=Microbispora sp. CA-135349 TaxID=3239953 RepID=UPI003D91BC66